MSTYILSGSSMDIAILSREIKNITFGDDALKTKVTAESWEDGEIRPRDKIDAETT